MVEFGCLETKTLKFCKDAEYQAGMSKSKHIKTKDRQSIFKSLKIHSKTFFYILKIGIYFSSRNKKKMHEQKLDYMDNFYS